MRFVHRGMIGLALLALAPLVLASAARAQETGQFAFEVFGGPYFPGERALDTDLVYGARFGQRPLPQLGWGLEIGGLDFKPINRLATVGAVEDTTGYFADGDVIWYVGGTNFGFFAGAGLGHVDMSFHELPDRSENALTVNGGVHYTWSFAQNVLIKPEIRLRWWHGNVYDKTDEEYTASVGWHF